MSDAWAQEAMKRGRVHDKRYRLCCEFIWRPEDMDYFLRCRWEPGHRGDHVGLDKADGLHRSANVDLSWPPRPVRLRTGRKVGRTLYLMIGGHPSDADTLIGVVDTPALAQMIVDAVNAGDPPSHEPSPQRVEFRIEWRAPFDDRWMTWVGPGYDFDRLSQDLARSRENDRATEFRLVRDTTTTEVLDA